MSKDQDRDAKAREYVDQCDYQSLGFEVTYGSHGKTGDKVGAVLRAWAQDDFIAGHDSRDAEVAALKAKIERAKGALEYYADKKNWIAMPSHERPTMRVDDLWINQENQAQGFCCHRGGRLAREALKELETK